MNDQIEQTPPSFWSDLVSFYRVCRVCRFSLIVTILGYVVFLRVPQGVEVLRSLGEESTFNVLGSGPAPVVKWCAIVLGALTWSLAAWYTCRVLLSFDFQPGQAARRPPGRWWQAVQPILRNQLPKLLGIAPLLIMAWGFWHASTTYDADAPVKDPTWLRGYAVACLLLAGLFYLFLVFRFRLSGLQLTADKRQVGDLAGSTRLALALMMALSLVLLLLFMVNPILFAGSMGSAAVLLFAAACWVFWGSVAVYVFERYRVPLLTLAVVWVALCSLWNDNHPVRTSPPTDFARQHVGAAFEAWRANIARYTQEPVHPLFIVATEGGGIRAAYWTATVLGRLEDAGHAAHLPDFSEHVFAISGVSGGSVGAAAFDAALTGEPGQPVTPPLQKMLGEDFLAPPLAALLYPDLLQRFLPFPLAGLDRGQWLERAWEQAGRRHLGNDCLAANFNDLWAQPHPRVGYLPALFLNGTSVESGQRIIASNVVVDRGFLDSIDAGAKVAAGSRGNCDVPLSTAAHGSARFTYVSPAGRFRDGTHIVDGGYFENSGSTTALEILRAVERTIAAQDIKDVRPCVIFISNNPLSEPTGGRDLRQGSASVALDQNQHRPGSFLEDALAPVWAMVNTRDAHDSYAQLALREGQGYRNVYFFGLSPSPIPLPLGWKLSGTAAREMNRQASESCADIDGKNNPAVFREVVGLLNGSTAIPPVDPAELASPARWERR